MKLITPAGGRIYIRQFHKSSAFCKPPVALTPSPQEHAHLQGFRSHALVPERPFLFQAETTSPTRLLPAASKWFSQTVDGASASSAWSLAPYMQQFEEWTFPYEVVARSKGKRESLAAFQDWLLAGQGMGNQILAGILQPSISETTSGSFFQLHAPLLLLIKALEFNRLHRNEPAKLLELYIAQCSLIDLPQSLQDDLPTPELVQRAGKGDVYSTSIWLGTEPTYTPLHRDPNPNLFCQLCNSKIIRLLPPASGDRLFFEVQVRIRQQGNSRIRSTEMMEGKEREELHAAVWEGDSVPEDMIEAEVGPGDALFIPQGWWHSVKSKGAQGHLNGSVNWWFR